MNLNSKQDESPEDEAFIESLFDKAVEIDSHSIYESVKNIDQRYDNEVIFAGGAVKDISSCTDQATGRLIAKAVLKEAKSDADYESFLREARITASLQHPNILPVHDLGLDEDGRPFFTMKLVDGMNLGELLSKRESSNGISLEELIEIFIKVTEAVAYAHSKGVIHLDIKPDNIQVSDFGEVLLCDWGIAKIIDDKWEDESFSDYSLSEVQDSNKTLDGFVKGTPGYMSPEQALPGSKRDERSDIYSLGALLYVMLTGEKPVKGKNLEELLLNTLKGNIKSPSEFKGNIPTSLIAVAMKALRLDPEERYQSANDLLSDIQSYTRGYVTEAEEAGLLLIFSRFIKRNKAVATLCFIFSVVSVVALFIFISNLREREAVAQKEKNRAVNALNALKEEKEVSSFYSEKFLSNLLRDAERAYERNDYEKAEFYLKFVGEMGNELLCRLRLMQGRLEEAEKIANNLDESARKDLLSIASLFRKLEGEEHKDLKTCLRLLLGADKSTVSATDILKVKSSRVREILLQKFINKLSEKDKVELVEHLLAQANSMSKIRLNKRGNSKTGYSIQTEGEHISSFNALKYLNVSSLKLLGTSITSLDELSRLSLKSFYITGSKITDIEFLRGMPLERVTLHCKKVADLSPLYENKTLKYVSLGYEVYTKQELEMFPETVEVKGSPQK